MFGDNTFDLGDSINLLRQAVREFATQKIAPIAHQVDIDNHFPTALWQEMGTLGLHGITVDAAYGGCDLGYLAHVVAMEEISAASAAIGLSYGAHSNLCINQLALHGNAAQRAQYLPGLVAGESIGALAISEPNSGSDAIGMQLSAQDHGTHYVLNGSKMWITNGPDADVIVTYAKTTRDAGAKGISAFIVDAATPGVRPAQKLDKLGMRGSNTCELVFENCMVPKDNLLGEKDQGIAVLMRGLDYERVVLSAGPIGIMRACLILAVPYLKTRKQFGQPVGDFQLMQGKLADMFTAYNAARSFVYAMARSCDAGTITRESAASVILFAAEQATQVALQTIQCLGGNGYMNEYAAGRLLRDAKLYEIGAGTSEIRRLLIGREIQKQYTQ